MLRTLFDPAPFSSTLSTPTSSSLLYPLNRTFFEALLEVHFSEFFCLEMVISFLTQVLETGVNHVRYALKQHHVLEIGMSRVLAAEAECPIVSDHHISILPFHVFLVSHETSRLTVSKPGRS